MICWQFFFLLLSCNPRTLQIILGDEVDLKQLAQKSAPNHQMIGQWRRGGILLDQYGITFTTMKQLSIDKVNAFFILSVGVFHYPPHPTFFVLTQSISFSHRIPFLSSNYHVSDRWMGGRCRRRVVKGGEQLSSDHRGYRRRREENAINRVEESCTFHFLYLISRWMKPKTI